VRLSKAEVLKEFQAAWADPAAARSGDIFDDRAVGVLKSLLPENRDTVVEVLRDWIRDDNAPKALVALSLAERFCLFELVDEIRRLDERIRDRRVFLPYYLWWTQRAISSLTQQT
jgi:hypothetical protein